MRKVILIMMLVCFLTLTGCMDMLQSVALEGEDIQIYLRLTVHKGMLEMGGVIAEDPDLAEGIYSVMEFDELVDELRAEMPPGSTLTLTRIDNEQEFGFALKGSVPKAELAELTEEEILPFIPFITPLGMSILVPGGDQADMDDEFTTMFFQGLKYRLLIGKSLAPQISQGGVVINGTALPFEVTELADVYLIEFPILYWFLTSGIMEIVISF